jgi:formylglycine-generating enzyme required for sulfatase activity
MGKRLCGAPTGGTAPYGSAELVLPLNSLWSYACTSNGVNAYPYGNYHNDGACNDVSAGTNTLAPVATFPACQAPTGFFHGIFDLSGNAWEWEDACQGGYCRVRGGDFWSQNMNCAAHAGQAVLKREATTGFRCCRLAGDLPM